MYARTYVHTCVRTYVCVWGIVHPVLPNQVFRNAGIFKIMRQGMLPETDRFTNLLGPPVEPCAVDISVGRVGQRTICIHKPMHASQLGRRMCNSAFVWPCVLCTQCHDMVVCAFVGLCRSRLDFAILESTCCF